MTVVIATRNRKKVEEIRRIFSGRAPLLLTMEAFPDCPEVAEDGKTFRANAIKKAVSIARYSGFPAIADDSGLEVYALGGAPGVYSARYAGDRADDRKNVRKLLVSLRPFGRKDERKARFVCCIAFAFPDGRYKTFTGYAEGFIGKKRQGLNGFGYDPVFYPSGYIRTFAQMSDAEKDALSHRGKALAKMFRYLRNLL